MLEGDPTQTSPTNPMPAPASRPSGVSAGRLVVVGLLAFALAALIGRVDLNGLVSGARTALPGVTPATQTTNASDSAVVAAVKDVVARANQAQAQAFAQNDPTLMRSTATDSYYQELVQTNRGLAASGARSIELTNLVWVDVTVNGNTAYAVTNETWRTAYSDGSVDSSTDRNEYTLVLQSGAWRISADVQPGTRVIGPTTGVGPTTVTQPGTPASATSSSSNWSGYVVGGGIFTSVTGTWVVPNVAANASGADATWVGIGGLQSRDLIQAGTQAMVDGSGTVEYSSWIEMLPASSRIVPLSVTAGDSVTATITQRTATDWTIAMKNNTTGDTYNVTVQYSSSNSSAEWIQEAPSIGRGLVSLDQFGTLQFSGASAVRDGKSMSLAALGAKAITMINGQGQAIAQPSTIGSDGSSFTVSRTDAPSTPSGGTRRGRP
jgi:hypothetical protein